MDAKQPRRIVSGRRILAHIDLRVRNRERATAFYDAIFAPLGIARSEGEGEWVSYDGVLDKDAYSPEWFGFTADAQMNAGSTRIALHAASRDEVDRVSEAARKAGAGSLEGPEELHDGYYAAFFEDLDGNKLEVCALE